MNGAAAVPMYFCTFSRQSWDARLGFRLLEIVGSMRHRQTVEAYMAALAVLQTVQEDLWYIDLLTVLEVARLSDPKTRNKYWYRMPSVEMNGANYIPSKEESCCICGKSHKVPSVAWLLDGKKDWEYVLNMLWPLCSWTTGEGTAEREC